MTVYYGRFVSEDAESYNEEYYLSQVAVIREYFEKRYEFAMKYLTEHVS